MPGFKKLRLDDQLCHALYAATNAIIRSYRPRLKRIGLTYPQYLVMLVLWQDGARPVRHIAERLGLSASAVTPLLDRLEAARLVIRSRDPVDRRIVHVAPTAAGRDLQEKASEVQQRVECETSLGHGELNELREELKALVLRLEAQTDEPANSEEIQEKEHINVR